MFEVEKLKQFESELRLQREITATAVDGGSPPGGVHSRIHAGSAIAALRGASGSAPPAQFMLRRIEAALARLEAGRFGICCQCHESMDTTWLAVDPANPFCEICADEIAEKRRRASR